MDSEKTLMISNDGAQFYLRRDEEEDKVVEDSKDPAYVPNEQKDTHKKPEKIKTDVK